MAVALLAVDVVVLFAGDFLTVAFFAGAVAALVVRAPVDFDAVVLAAAVFEAVDFEAVVFAVDRAGVFLAGAALAADFVAVVLADVVFAAADLLAVAFVAVGLGSTSFGSFFAPDTTAFSSAPGVNFGMAVFLALIRSPVRGLRTHRASRTRFSKEPKPVIATFSPLATSRVIVSTTASSACCAALRLPSNLAASVSTS